MSDYKDFYRDALVSRSRALRAALDDGVDDAERAAAVRRIAHALRGSGGSYGFPEISAAAAFVEDAPPDTLHNATEKLLVVLHETVQQTRPSQNVLIVDDDVSMVLLIEAVLESLNANVHAAGTGTEARAALVHGTYDLVILDLQLPDMDGRTLLLRMRDNARTARVPVAILSASASSSVKTECLALGADAFFEKPIDPHEFAEAIAAILRRGDKRAPAAPEGEPPAEAGATRIVLVEDDALVASLVNHRLTRAGYEVVHFTDGFAGAAGAAAENPALIILDVKVPGIDGFEVLRRLRADAATQSTPVLMLTSLGNEDSIVRAFELGAADYVTKPFSPAELLARVQRLLEARA